MIIISAAKSIMYMLGYVLGDISTSNKNKLIDIEPKR